jgi:glycosyltransferase involved in cell wall biosynthesis
VVISNGILPIYQPGEYKRKDDLKDKFIILSVGRFAPEKRHDMIISAIQDSRYKDKIQLILIGEGPKKEKLQKIGITLTNPPIFLSLPSEELVYYYNIADLYVHAAVVEVECMTVLESIGCGLPPLISDSHKSATKQFALDNSFLYESENGLNLVSKIDYWIEHQPELRNARIRYYEHSLNYRIEKSYEKLINLYFSLLSS